MSWGNKEFISPLQLLKSAFTPPEKPRTYVPTVQPVEAAAIFQDFSPAAESAELSAGYYQFARVTDVFSAFTRPRASRRQNPPIIEEKKAATEATEVTEANETIEAIAANETAEASEVKEDASRVNDASRINLGATE
ncbi:hypothetical protein [uncultured Arcanobacterium sp.]|uniref:hypothetical protein n=1 Tax=uncultured Arcanobacterium sp. TaxID=487520 RepID=UPI002633D6B9|nr:hypothetical protein [uncultured Arcanobacterium sp.]